MGARLGLEAWKPEGQVRSELEQCSSPLSFCSIQALYRLDNVFHLRGSSSALFTTPVQMVLTEAQTNHGLVILNSISPFLGHPMAQVKTLVVHAWQHEFYPPNPKKAMRREQVPQIHTNLFYDLHISTMAHVHIHTLLVVDCIVCINLSGGD